MHVDARQILVQALEGLAHFGGDGDGVRAGLLVDGQADSFDAVDQHQVVDLRIDHADFAEVRHPHCLAGAAFRRVRIRDVAHHHVGDVLGAAKPRQAAHQVDAVVVFQSAGGDIDVLAGDPVLQHRQGDAEGVEPVAIHRHPHFLFAAAGDAHLGNAGQLLQRRRQLATRQAPELRQIRRTARRDQPQRQDGRLARVETAHQHFVHLRIALDGAHRLLHVHQGDVQVHVPVEDDRGHQPAAASHLRDIADAAHGEQHLLHPFAVETLHFRGRAAARTHGNDHRGTLQIGKQIHGQIVPRQPAQQGHCQRNHADRHRPAGGQGGNVLESRHGSAGAWSAGPCDSTSCRSPAPAFRR